ncbi:MAG: hypothetical protein COB02_15310 [Candidatus Cloacimonadota bacterium]|nr:MAG: hypothetical protein COB02_15310 [Candidatus Cloacimonadota bacterium]
MPINYNDFLTFLQKEISKDFESETKKPTLTLFTSKQKNILISLHKLENNTIVNLQNYITATGDTFTIHLVNHKSSYNLLIKWTQLMVCYLLIDDFKAKDQKTLVIAQNYKKSMKNIVLNDFKDPDSENNYAISKLAHLEIECLNLKQTKSIWFEITDTKKELDSTNVRQIFVPLSDDKIFKNKFKIIDDWLQQQINDLDKKLLIQVSKTISYKSQLIIVFLIFLVWLTAFYFSPV